MEGNTHKPNSVIGKYINSCEQAKHPLSSVQIGLLEKTINEAFGIKKNKSPSVDVFTSFDRDALNQIARVLHSDSGRLSNILRRYRVKNLGMSDDLPLTDADAWSLYDLTAREIEKTTYKALKEEYRLPKTYGFSGFALLHSYFISKGIIEEDSHFPRPIDL